jgi:hypothetical protein
LRGDKEEIVKMSALSFLISTQNQDGGWGYAPQQGSAVEPTSAVLLALRNDPYCARSCQRAIEWLRKTQNPDGGWGFNSKDKESGWQTAWAVLALALSGEASGVLNQGVKWLLDVKTAQFGEDTMQASKKISMVDLSLRGWPWLSGEASWVEPTALTMLALESIPGTEITKRLKESFLYIQDRRCPGGGWNVGSPTMFNLALPARAYPTALVLLALTRSGLGNIQGNDISVLRSQMHRDGGVLALAWGFLALRTLGGDDVSAEDRLSILQGRNGGWADSPFKTAASVMAFKGYL